MGRRLLGGMVGLLALAGVLAGCAAQSNLTPVPADRVAREIKGVWVGDLINGERRFEPATFVLDTPEPGKVTGKGKLPESEFERLPILSGSYSGNEVTLKSHAGGRYYLKMRTDKAGDLYLEGPAAEAEVGTLRLRKL